MRRFIIKTIFFLIPILIVASLMEMLLRNIPNDYLYKKEYLNEHSSEIETLILGSSHSFYGFDPVFFSSKAFNASNISQSLDFDYKILQKYQTDLGNLQTVVIPISYFTLYARLEIGSESWRIKNYVIYSGMSVANSVVDYFEVLSNKPKVNLQRLYSYYISGRQNLTCTKLGWGTSYKSEDSKDLVETGKTAAKRHTVEDIYSEKYSNIFNHNKLLLNSIVKWCKKRNMKVLLITPPAFGTYRRNINMEQYNTTIKTANDIASKYDNCIYVNLFDDMNFSAKYFYDADHLSEIGAEKLSKQIDEKIKEWE